MFLSLVTSVPRWPWHPLPLLTPPTAPAVPSSICSLSRRRKGLKRPARRGRLGADHGGTQLSSCWVPRGTGAELTAAGWGLRAGRTDGLKPFTRLGNCRVQHLQLPVEVQRHSRGCPQPFRSPEWHWAHHSSCTAPRLWRVLVPSTMQELIPCPQGSTGWDCCDVCLLLASKLRKKKCYFLHRFIKSLALPVHLEDSWLVPAE